MLLAQKCSAVLSLLSRVLPNVTLPSARMFESARKHFRSRVYLYTLCLLNQEGAIEYIQENGMCMPSFPWCFERINSLMAGLRDACMERPTLAHLLQEACFLGTLSGDSCLTLIYHRPLDVT